MAAPLAGTPSRLPRTKQKQRYQKQLLRSIQRANSARDRITSALAREFFDVARNNSLDEKWRTLPRRLIRLADYLRDDPMSTDHEKEGLFSVRVSCDINESRRVSLGAAVFALAPPTFLSDFRTLFEALLKARQRQWKQEQQQMYGDEAGEDTMDTDSGAENDGEDEDDPENHAQLLAEEEQLYQSLSILGWLKSQLRRPFRESLQSVMMNAITSLIAGNFESEGMLDRTLEWKSAVLIPWVHDVVGAENFENDKWEAQLEYAASECFVHVRMKELFDLVTDYPDSIPAVKELSVALDSTGRLWYHSLASEWRNALVQRLIHPGAQTSQIIDVYINTIKVLREMDPSGELLQVVTQPVREYLRDRADTVRCIITSLTDEESGGDLYEELRRNDAKPLEEAQLDEEDEEDPPTFDWEPPPSILQRRGVITGQVGRVTSSSRRAGDILSMLVGIYGSKELFVNEYRIMLADKLLSNLEYDTDKEVHNLELLKLRFGEISMRQCEVMIKDIDDSKRVHSNIRSTLLAKETANASNDKPNENDQPVVDAAIVSHIFWPALQKEQFKNHPRIQSKLDQFSIEYAKLKNPRRLVWMKQLGTVQLEVEVYEESDVDGSLTSQVKEVTCTPVHATLLAHFEDKGKWSSEELSNETGMTEELVRKRMGFWINQRVVKTVRQSVPDAISGTGSTYVLLSVNESESNDQSFIDQHDDDDEERAVSIGAHEEEEMKVFESYIVSMLSNLGQLPLERIHSMLKTFVAGSDHKYDKTPQQLAVFLQQLCKEEKLERSPDGLYKHLKKRS